MSHDAKAVMDALHNHALLVIDQRSPVAAKQPVENVPSYPFTASFPGDGGWVSDELFAGALKNGTHTFFTLFLVPFSLPEGLHMCLGYPEAMKARVQADMTLGGTVSEVTSIRYQLIERPWGPTQVNHMGYQLEIAFREKHG